MTGRALERAFREYLRQVTSRTSFPLTLIYKPPQSLNFHPIRFHSPIPTSSLPMSTLIIQPLTPRFFSLITGYKDAQSGFNAMIAQRILKADSSCFLWVSDHACLMQVIASTQKLLAIQRQPSSQARARKVTILRILCRWLRNNREETFMDHFIYDHVGTDQQHDYQRALIHHLLAEKLAHQSPTLVVLYYILVTSLMLYLALQAVFFCIQRRSGVVMDTLLLPAHSMAILYSGWAMWSNFFGTYRLNPLSWGNGV